MRIKGNSYWHFINKSFTTEQNAMSCGLSAIIAVVFILTIINAAFNIHEMVKYVPIDLFLLGVNLVAILVGLAFIVQSYVNLSRKLPEVITKIKNDYNIHYYCLYSDEYMRLTKQHNDISKMILEIYSRSNKKMGEDIITIQSEVWRNNKEYIQTLIDNEEYELVEQYKKSDGMRADFDKDKIADFIKTIDNTQNEVKTLEKLQDDLDVKIEHAKERTDFFFSKIKK